MKNFVERGTGNEKQTNLGLLMEDSRKQLRSRYSSTEINFKDIIKENFEELENKYRLFLGKERLYIYMRNIIDPLHTHANMLICSVILDDKSFGIEKGNIPSSLLEETFDDLSQIDYFRILREKFNIKIPEDKDKKEAKSFLKVSVEKAKQQQKNITEVMLLAEKNKL